MIALDKNQWYYLDELTTEQLREVAAAILTDIEILIYKSCCISVFNLF